jgi:2-keto-4-pentenoate hydratase
MTEIVKQRSQAAEIAACFVEARKAAICLPDYPGPVPDTMSQAYAVQDEAIALRGGEIGGWKLGRIPPPEDKRMGANRLAGPIFQDLIVTAPGDGLASMPVIADGFAAAEAEFLLRLGTDVLPGRAGSKDLLSLVDRVAVGIEIASSPLPAINDLGPAVTASDFGNNHGLLVGQPLDPSAWHSLNSIEVSLAIDGHVVGRATTATMLDGPWGALRFLLELAEKRGLALYAGQWISTGAVTGVHRIAPGQRADAKFGDLDLACIAIGANRGLSAA